MKRAMRHSDYLRTSAKPTTRLPRPAPAGADAQPLGLLDSLRRYVFPTPSRPTASARNSGDDGADGPATGGVGEARATATSSTGRSSLQHAALRLDLLFETIVQAPSLFPVARKPERIENTRDFFPGLAAGRRPADGGRRERRVGGGSGERLYTVLRDREGSRRAARYECSKNPQERASSVLFAKAWPDSTFVYLYREPRQTLASMIEVWSTGRFRTYPRLPDWTGLPWSLLLVPGWRDLIGKPLAEVVAAQWAITTDNLVGDLEALPLERVRNSEYDHFIANRRARSSG